MKTLVCKIDEIKEVRMSNDGNHDWYYSVWDGDLQIAHGVSSSRSWVINDAGGYHTKNKFDVLYPDGWEVDFTNLNIH